MGMFVSNGQHTLYTSGSGRYDAFPVAASNGAAVVALWRSATVHTADHAANTKSVFSTDGGRTWTAPVTAYDDSSNLIECSATGVVWDHVRSRWVAIMVRKTYSSPTSNDSPALAAFLIQSDDGVSWTVSNQTITRPSSVAWWFPSSLAITQDGTLIAGLYGRSTSAWSNAFVAASTDGGNTWSLVADLPYVAASGQVNVSEPQVCMAPDGSFVLTANTGNTGLMILSAASPDGLVWSDLALSIAGYAGAPSLGSSFDAGSMLMLLRQPASADNTHGLWSYATSTDNGATWDVRDDFPDQTRMMMYGGVTETDGALLVVYASEDNPTSLWNGASVFWTRFVPARLTTTWDNSLPALAVRVESSAPGRVERVWTDILGQEIVEEVRHFGFDGDTQWALDYEAQQGRTYTYRCAGLVSDPVTVPVLDQMVLVHPTRPEWSVPVIVAEDMDDRSYQIDRTTTALPSRRPGAGSSLASVIVTTSGVRSSAASATTLKTETLLDREALLRLLSDGTPLFWSAHPGSDMPEWISPGADVRVKRFVNMCSHNHDDPDDTAQWRIVTLPWDEQDRPTRRQLPVHRRIRDYNQTFNTLAQAIGEL